MKKFLAVFLTVAMSFSALTAFVGCKKDDNVEKGATVITMYCQDFEEWNNNWVESMKDSFNSIMDDGIQLDIKYFQDEAYTDALKVARETGKAPDIFMTSYGNLYNDSIKTGYAAPLNDLLDAKYFADLLDNVKEMVSFENKYYAYPQLTEPSTLFFWRKDYFEAAGLDANAAPKSWDELKSVCASVKSSLKKGQYTIGLPIGTALGWATYGMQYNTTGGVALNDKWDEILVQDNEQWRELLGFFYDLYANGYVPAGNVSAKGYNDIIEALCSNKLAMTFAGSWSIAEIVNTYPEMVDKIGVAPIPTLSGNQDGVTATNGGWTFSVSASSDQEHQQKAARVLEYFFCEDAARTASYFEAAHYSKAAVNKSVQEYLDTNADDEFKEWLSVVNSVSSKAKPEPTYPWDISIAVSTMFEYMAINCDKNKDTIIPQQIATCISTIQSVMARTDWTTNPRA